MPVTPDLELLIHAAESAGDIATGFYRGQNQVWQKPDGAGPVTEADLAVDQFLKDALTEARPDYGWLSEETTDTPYEVKESALGHQVDGEVVRAYQRSDRLEKRAQLMDAWSIYLVTSPRP